MRTPSGEPSVYLGVRAMGRFLGGVKGRRPPKADKRGPLTPEEIEYLRYLLACGHCGLDPRESHPPKSTCPGKSIEI